MNFIDNMFTCGFMINFRLILILALLKVW